MQANEIRLPPPFQPSVRSDLTPGFLPVAKAVFLRYKAGEKTWEIRTASKRFSEANYPPGREVRVCNGYQPDNGFVKRIVGRRVEAPDYWSLPEEIDAGAVLDRANLRDQGSHYFDASQPVVAIELLPPPEKPAMKEDAKDIVVVMLPSRILQRAGDLLERGWARSGAMAHDELGRPVDPLDKSAVAWSMSGAMERASYDLLADPPAQRYAPGRIQAWQRAHGCVTETIGVARTQAWEKSSERGEEEWRDVIAAAQVLAETREEEAA